MGFEIDEKIIRRAHCSKMLMCLSGEENLLCRAVEDKGGLLYVQTASNEHQSCSKMLRLSSMTLCNCPVRQEIFRKYQM